MGFPDEAFPANAVVSQRRQWVTFADAEAQEAGVHGRLTTAPLAITV